MTFEPSSVSNYIIPGRYIPDCQKSIGKDGMLGA
jgi:hypothetical protein